MKKLICAILIVSLVLMGTAAIFAAISPYGNDSNDNTDQSFRPLSPRQHAVKSLTTTIHPNAQIERVIVKLVESSRGRLNGVSLHSLGGKDLRKVNDILKDYSRGNIRRLLNKSPDRIERDKFLLENKCGRQLADFNNYFAIDVASASEAEQLVNALNRLPVIEIAYAEPKPEPSGDIPPTTPAYDSLQAYLRPAPGGIDADYAKTIPGGDGAGVKLLDIEGNWQFDHEDLEFDPAWLIAGTLIDDPNWRQHGAAVFGIMKGGDNSYGVTGIVPAADVGMSSIGTIGTAGAIIAAADAMSPGDIILIEINAPGPRFDFQIRSDQLGYVCMEYWQANFDAIQYAWARGVIVCQSAGNGAENLDDPIYENLFDTTFRNSHAILIGAGAPPSGNYGYDLSRLEFSNNGNRVNLQGYGEEVATAGYGQLFSGGGDERQYYTSLFRGTSSATPIVAGAVAAMQGIHKTRYSGAVMDADVVRNLLVATGTPQYPSTWKNIGPRPNLAAADSAMTPPPDITLDPIYFDTTVTLGDQITVFFDIINDNPSLSYEFDMIGNDSLGKDPIGDWLTIVNPTGVVGPSGNVSIEVNIDASVIEDRSDIYKGIIDIAYGEQGGPLDDHDYVPVFLTVPCADTTYAATSSDDIDGPEFQWLDITATGSEIQEYSWYNDFVTEEILDDGSAGPYFIGFDFPFFDSTYDYIFIGANGAISLTDTNVNVDGYYDDQVSIPNPPFQTFISPFWNDLNLDQPSGGHGAVYFKRRLPDSFVIAYHEVAPYSFLDDSVTFEIILHRNGNLSFQYLTVGDSGIQDSAVVGIAEYDCRSYPYVIIGDPVEHIVSDSMAVLFDYAYIVWEMSGDVNFDGNVNVGDAVYLISWIFKGGPAPPRMIEADPNCDADANVADAVYLINYIFKSGPPPCEFEL